MGLVKQIEVDAVLLHNYANQAYVKLLGFDDRKGRIGIKLEIFVNTGKGVQKKNLVARASELFPDQNNLHYLSGGLSIYPQELFYVDEPGTK